MTVPTKQQRRVSSSWSRHGGGVTLFGFRRLVFLLALLCATSAGLVFLNHHQVTSTIPAGADGYHGSNHSSVPQQQQKQPQAKPSPPRLPEIYRQIAQQALSTSSWPDCDAFVKLLHTDPQSGKIVPPRFADGYGPVGVSFQFGRTQQQQQPQQHNQQAQALLSECTRALTAFVKEAESLYNSNNDNNTKNNNWFYKPPPATLHMIVAIFQAHPSFLSSDEERRAWQPIGPRQMPILIQSLHDALAQQPPIVVRLDSLLWTPDGALIAGFAEDNDENAIEEYLPFTQLKSTCVQAALRALPTGLTTRPKKLMHVTLGRLLRRPPTDAQQTALMALMQRYNRQVLPDLVRDIVSVHNNNNNNKGRMLLDELVLIREWTWLSNEYEELAVFSFDQDDRRQPKR